MHDFPLLINITLALVVAFIGGPAARRLGLPTMVHQEKTTMPVKNRLHIADHGISSYRSIRS